MSVRVSGVRVFDREEFLLLPFVFIFQRLFVDDMDGQDGQDDGDDQESDAAGQSGHRRRGEDDATVRHRSSHRWRQVGHDCGWSAEGMKTRKRHDPEVVAATGTQLLDDVPKPSVGQRTGNGRPQRNPTFLPTDRVFRSVVNQVERNVDGRVERLREGDVDGVFQGRRGNAEMTRRRRTGKTVRKEIRKKKRLHKLKSRRSTVIRQIISVVNIL